MADSYILPVSLVGFHKERLSSENKYRKSRPKSNGFGNWFFGEKFKRAMEAAFYFSGSDWLPGASFGCEMSSDEWCVIIAEWG